MPNQSGYQPPAAGRPDISADYGISTKPEGLLAWSWVSERMAASKNYWICSTRPDGRPHAAPVWGVWLDETLYFGTSRKSRKGANIQADPRVAIHLESGDEAVMLEGVLEEETSMFVLARVASAYAGKYTGYTPNAEDLNGPGNITYRLRPNLVMAWQEKDFPQTATRWVFKQDEG